MIRKALAVSDKPDANLARVRKKWARPSVLRRRMQKISVAVVLSDSTLSMDCLFRSLYSLAMCLASRRNSICRHCQGIAQCDHRIKPFTGTSPPPSHGSTEASRQGLIWCSEVSAGKDQYAKDYKESHAPRL